MTESKRGRQRLLAIGRKVAGVCLIVVGVIGLFLPFLQGIALIVLGLVLLGKKHWIYVIGAFFRRIARFCRTALRLRPRRHAVHERTDSKVV